MNEPITKRPVMTPKHIYIAGPYRAPNAWEVEQNIRAAEAVAIEVAKLGAYPQCPHTNTRGYFEHVQADPNFWLEATLEMMRRCDGVFMMETWRQSSGARAEHEEAKRLKKPIFYGLTQLDFALRVVRSDTDASGTIWLYTGIEAEYTGALFARSNA